MTYEPPKKPKTGASDVTLVGRCAVDPPDDELLRKFADWCYDQGFLFNTKVKISKSGSCAHYGLIAIGDIFPGEVLFKIPRSALVCPDNSKVGLYIKQEKSLESCENPWIPLLITLLHEYKSGDSRFQPYFDIVPHRSQIDLPLLWDKDEVSRLLAGTNIPENVRNNLQQMKRDFDVFITPFLDKYPQLFHPDSRSFAFYCQMVAFVMAYSFSSQDNDDDDDDDDDDGDDSTPPPVMAPVADILNHVSKHSAFLQYGEKSLNMVACGHVEKGGEIYNTYGPLSNADLLTMYGFAEEPTKCLNDEVLLSRPLLQDVSERIYTDLHDLREKWSFLISQEMGEVDAERDVTFSYTSDGFHTDTSSGLMHILQVLEMSAEEFKVYVNKSEEERAEEDGDDRSLTNAQIQRLPVRSKALLRECCERRVGELPAPATSTMCERSRERYASYVCAGHRTLYNQLARLCSP